ncbi:putative bifunctional diguanylate cyclase/phosphodiesterase [Zavarzinia sp. CC-PAN008]|uniref:putative bifunctional diguanylate cyclase/phosphodiesterase n=1 Tax=Zavarzinia sp. CC-PAN008 TaxID=3243332 RepID=UPI003F74A325
MSANPALLARVPLFERLDEAERTELASLAEELNMPAGTLVFRFGEPGGRMFVVTHGAVELSVRDHLGQRILLETAREGQVFGELSLFDAGPRTADALVVEDATLCALDREHLIAFLKAKPEAGIDLLATLSNRIRETNLRLRRTASRNANETLEQRSSPIDRLIDGIAQFSGSIQFLLLHVVVFALWIIWNEGVGARAFDPFPFGFLTMAVSLEAIILSVIVLLSQNRSAQRDKVRTDIEYEINVKAEQEIAHLHEKVDNMQALLMQRLTAPALSESSSSTTPSGGPTVVGLSNHLDPLTGLANRALLHDRMHQAIRQARRTNERLALHVIEMVGYAATVESFGRGVADQVIFQAAERLRRFSRETATLARVGSETFALLQSRDPDGDAAALLAGRLLTALAEPYTIGGAQVHTNARAGASLYPSDSDAPDALLRNAELALARAREAGVAFQLFEPGMNEQVQIRIEIERELRQALAETGLKIAYQPKWDLKTRRVSGVEALLRWTHPDRGAISPATFVPIAERTGLIVPLGLWALERACTEIRSVVHAGFGPLKLAVNLSPQQFRDPDLEDSLKRALDSSGFEPRNLELELTESSVMQDVDRAVEILQRLARMGLSFSIDDFGTGFSSLAHLQRFPVQRIKIDKAFVDRIGPAGDGGTIARSVISLGHGLNMAVTAEGVETQEQWNFLAAHECDEIQGFLFSRPLPVDELTRFLRTQREQQPPVP